MSTRRIPVTELSDGDIILYLAVPRKVVSVNTRNKVTQIFLKGFEHPLTHGNEAVITLVEQ